MERLKEVEEAVALMQEAVNWSVMKWLAEKKRVRKAADKANEALAQFNKSVKASWSAEMKAAYAELCSTGKSAERQAGEKGNHTATITQEIRHVAKHVKEADDEAYRAHMDAEDTFDLAEKRLSTSMAREGTRKAINSWELLEKAIDKAQAVKRSNGSAS
ncbi:MAG: hypothetical protein CXZ00_08250 [Acidobacteria bacterium]|nr:MAG: hypothetical protein CXZ00_08250 [Acidobacteriota bacterium]